MTPDLDLFLKAAGEIAAREAERLWALDIIDPPKGSKHPRAKDSLEVINEIIREAGWGWATPYTGNGSPQWCGMFAAKCWRAAGIATEQFATYWASTYRLGLWARYQKFDAKHPNPPPAADEPHRMISSGLALHFTPRRGDIVIVGDGEPAEGDHVTVCVGWNYKTRTADTISGNGGGLGPFGDKREGISRRSYAVDGGGYRILWVIRPAPSDVVNFSVERG